VPTDAEIEAKFWKELKASPFVMLGLDGERDGATQPMTAHSEGEQGPLWFFTAKDHDIVQALARTDQAIATYTAKGHDLFASITGTLSLDNDRAVIDRLWNPVAAQWYEGGKDDPKLALLRLDTESAKIWVSDLGGLVKPTLNRLFGRHPEAGYEEKIAEVEL
jgi:general stress protein 26